MKHYWGVYDLLINELGNKVFYSRREARDCARETYNVKVVKLVIQPEKKTQKKDKVKVEYFTYNNFYYKIEDGKVYTYWRSERHWDVIPSCTTPEWVRKNITKVSANEIKEMTND